MPVILEPGVGVDVSENARRPLAPWAPVLQLRGRFEDRGRGPEAFDCMGLVVFVQSILARPVRDYLDCCRDVNIRATRDVDALFRAESDAWRNVGRGDVGDVLVLGRGNVAHHVAVLCGAGRALHAQAGAGLRIDEIEGRRNVTRFAGLKVFGCVAPG